MALAAILGLVFLLFWALVVALLGLTARTEDALASEARAALVEFSNQALELQTVDEILDFAAQASRIIFGTRRPIGFTPGDGAGWTAREPDRDGQLPEVAATARGVFGWFRHNSRIVLRAELADARLGAMRAPLRQLMDQYGVDALLPLVHRGQCMAVFGIALGRAPSRIDRRLLRQFNLEVAQACANVRLHREASHVISLAKEVDLASAVQQTLVPAVAESQAAGLTWAGHFRAVGDAGSDFWSVYPLAGDKLVVLVADATGVGLAGSMVSAVVKSCCDGLLDSPEGPATDDPAALLRAVNVALWRADDPVHMTAFAAVFDVAHGVVRYANAGHRAPYKLVHHGGLEVLSGAGAVLGDERDARYKVIERQATGGDVFVFHTDGIVDTRNPEGETFGERKLQQLLAASKATTGATTARSLRDAIVSNVDRFRGPAPLRDDRALVVVRIGGQIIAR